MTDSRVFLGIGGYVGVEYARTLVERGILDQHGSGRGVWYDLR
ncbi:hypothetical protein [Thiolapillus sp.]